MPVVKQYRTYTNTYTDHIYTYTSQYHSEQGSYSDCHDTLILYEEKLHSYGRTVKLGEPQSPSPHFCHK